MRMLITGGVGSGKTTLSQQVRGSVGADYVRHTDDLIDTMEWSEVSAHVASVWFHYPGPWIIEGVAIPRALRKYLEANPHAPPPCDRIIVLTDQHKDLNARQEAMSRTVYEHMSDLSHWLGDLVEWR
jgi:Fe-S cluster assembly ATPase SufC